MYPYLFRKNSRQQQTNSIKLSQVQKYENFFVILKIVQFKFGKSECILKALPKDFKKGDLK